MEFKVGTFTSLPLGRICCGLYSSLLATRSSICCFPQTSTLDRQDDRNIYRRRRVQDFGNDRVIIPSRRVQRRRPWWGPPTPYPCRAAPPRQRLRRPCEPRALMSPCEPRSMSGSQAYATSLKEHKNKDLRVLTWADIGSRGKTKWSGRWESNISRSGCQPIRIRGLRLKPCPACDYCVKNIATPANASQSQACELAAACVTTANANERPATSLA
jgi:hypothetical protein